MRVLVDENIPGMTVNALADMGHDVLDILGTDMQGASDSELWTIAQQERRVVVTTDRGFAGRTATPHHGVLVVRLRQPNRKRIHGSVMRVIGRFAESEWPGLIVTARDRAMSVRRIRQA